MKAGCVAILVLGAGVPSFAQATKEPPNETSLRASAMVSLQRFSAATTFESIFGRSLGTLIGAGITVTHRRFFVDLTVSRFKKTGERAFVFEEEGYGLGIPLTITVVPMEVTAGYRFTQRGSVVPYAGAGLGLYRYVEESPSGDPDEEVRALHLGMVILGGAEIRFHRWVAMGLEGQYTLVPGILGQGGLSQEVGETNLGGVAARVRFIVGR